MEHKNEYKKTVYLIAIISALGGLLFGLDQGFIALSLNTIEKVYAINTSEAEAYTSILALGGVFGTISSGFTNKLIGRRNSLVLAGFIFTLMSLISGLLPSFEILKIARFFLGFAVGIASFSVPLYLAETAPKEIRGKMGTMFQLMITVGIFVIALANYIISEIIKNAELSLTIMFVFLLVFSLLMLVSCLFLPKSPRWLLSRGQTDEARNVLSKIWHTKKAIKREIKEFKITSNKTINEPLYKLICDKFFLKVLFLGVVIQMFQQLVGINFIIYYAPTTLGYAGLTGAFSLLILYFINMVFTFPAIKLTDKWGRKKLLYMGSIVMMVSMLSSALAFYMLNKLLGIESSETIFFRYLLLASFSIYIMAFAVSWGPVAWIICSEIFPFRSKEVGMTITTMVNWTFVGVVSFTSLSVMKLFGNFASPLMFAGFCFLSIIFLKFFVPETKGISLEEIENNLLSGCKLRDIGETKNN